MAKWPPPIYEIRAEFHAPLRFAFRWCTDYGPSDDELSGETYERRVLQRSARRVIFEDLWWKDDGWRWRRYDVLLSPPDHWRARSIGNVRSAEITYHLQEVSGGRTRLTLRMKRRPGLRDPHQPSKRSLERELRAMWRNLGRALENDYRRSLRGTRPVRPRKGR